MMNPAVWKLIEKQNLAAENVGVNCAIKYGAKLNNSKAYTNQSAESNIMCPPMFDTILCWPPQEPNSTASVSCPKYMIGFLSERNAIKECYENGTWSKSFYDDCYEGDRFTKFTDIPINDEETISSGAMKLVTLVTEIGYVVSLVSLIIAFTIMFRLKKLHCARNILHMNLFASFILKAFINILKESLFNDGAGLDTDLLESNGSLYFHVDDSKNNYECKLIVSLMQYFSTANYSWILMEGLYLNNLILRALFTDTNRNLIYYIVFGWGLPILVVVPWVIARILVEDTLCWTTNENFNVFAIIVIPTFSSVLINLVLFVIISGVLYKKLKSPINEDSMRYLKWAKSTLVLVPLFGVNYGVLLVLYFVDEKIIWMICNSIFGSFQGFFVAILYCFLNGEVKAEIKPYMKSVLIFLATNDVTKYCFPKREKYLSSAVGRQSVCTTMSCSSLYNNGLNAHRSSRTKCEQLSKSKLISGDNTKEVFIPNGMKHSVPKTGNGHYAPNLSFVHGRYPMNMATTNIDLSMTNDVRSHYYSQNLPTCEEEMSMLELDATANKSTKPATNA